MAVFYPAVSMVFALGAASLLSVISMIVFFAVVASVVALPTLALAMLFTFYFAGYVRTRPLLLAIGTTGFGLLPGLFIGQFPLFLLVALPGLVVSAVKLTRSFDRIAEAIDDDES